MTIQELKDALLGKQYQTPIRIGPHAVITGDVQRFLTIQFIECENWRKELEKCPAYERLIAFYEATKSQA